MIKSLFIAFFVFSLPVLVNAGLYVVRPSQGSKCHGGQKCTVEWLDDGIAPLVTAIGVCKVGLYHGRQKLVQTIEPVDVSSNHSLTFIPNASAGPDSDTYYISFISTSANQSSGAPYLAFSPFFSLDQMTGSFDSPLPSATAPIPIPSALSHSSTSLSTITVGTLSTSLPPLPTVLSTQKSSHTSSTPSASVTSGSSRFTTSIVPSSLPSASSTGSAASQTPSAPSNGALGRPAHVLALIGSFVFVLIAFVL